MMVRLAHGKANLWLRLALSYWRALTVAHRLLRGLKDANTRLGEELLQEREKRLLTEAHEAALEARENEAIEVIRGLQGALALYEGGAFLPPMERGRIRAYALRAAITFLNPLRRSEARHGGH
jgi:hypothetical protein